MQESTQSIIFSLTIQIHLHEEYFADPSSVFVLNQSDPICGYFFCYFTKMYHGNSSFLDSHNIIRMGDTYSAIQTMFHQYMKEGKFKEELKGWRIKKQSETKDREIILRKMVIIPNDQLQQIILCESPSLKQISKYKYKMVGYPIERESTRRNFFRIKSHSS